MIDFSKYTMVINDFDANQLRDYLKLLNEFRQEYFLKTDKKSSVELVNKEHFKESRQRGIISVLVYNHHRPVAVLELSNGNTYGNRTIGISTIYVIPKYRGQGLAASHYDFAERLAEQMNVWFCIQVEQSSLYANRDKFIQLGFYWYMPQEFAGELKYEEQTYLLYRQPYLKRLQLLDKLEEAA